MGKIQPSGSGNFRKYRKPGSKKESSSVHHSHKSRFSELWEAESGDSVGAAAGGISREVEETLEELVDDVHQQGEKLKEQPSYEHIREYKEVVRRFLSYVVTHSLEVETKEGARFNPMKKQRRYTLVKIIDEKLEQLASGIMQSQGAQLDILRKVEEINGLVIDLMS